MRIIYAVIIIIFIIIIYNIATCNTVTYEDYLYGYWIAEADDFCEDSQIESMQLFIGKSEGYWRRKRHCYLVIMNNMCNQGLTMSYKTTWAGPVLSKYSIQADIEFDINNIWEDRVNIDVDMCTGVLRIYGDGILYAKLHKQHDITNMCTYDVQILAE